jgi:DNA repair protein RecO (recombination protein O)
MDWSDDGIVLSGRPHGEAALILTLLTREHGRHAGLVPGGASSSRRAMFQAGNQLRVEWRARLSEHLGHYRAELQAPHAAKVLDDPLALAGLSAACAVIDTALPEREPHPAMFDGFAAFLSALGHPGWPTLYVRLELGLLQELGYGLDLSSCAATGAVDDLAWVSPKSGRAVSREAGEPYRDRLLPLPAFLAAGGAASPEEVRMGCALSGHFLERRVYWLTNKPLPAARDRFMDMLNSNGRPM